MQPPKKKLKSISEGTKWPEPIRYKDRSGQERDFTQGNARALGDTLASVLGLHAAPDEIEAWYRGREMDGVAGALRRQRSGSGEVTGRSIILNRRDAERIPEVLAHEMGHVGDVDGSWWPRVMDPRDERAQRVGSIYNKAHYMPDSTKNMFGLPIGQTGGNGEKFPEVVSRTYGAIERAGNTYRPAELDAQRDSLSADAEQMPLIRDMLDVFVSAPEYERMKWLAKPKLPKAGVADAVRRK